MNINDEISYNWTVGWKKEDMASPRPIVNPLLKAILEKDIKQRKYLFQQGAELEKVDKCTFERVLYHVLDNKEVIQLLIEHGFHGIFGNFTSFQCVTPQAYCSGLIARAWQLGAYDVMELLAQNGFSYSMYYYFIMDQDYDMDEECFKRGDVRAIKILVENGLPPSTFDWACKKYPNSKVTRYLNDDADIEYNSIALSPYLFTPIPKPKLEKVGFFFRKSTIAANEKLIRKYNLLLAAQKKWIDELGIGHEEWLKMCEEKRKQDREFWELVIDMSNVK